MTNKLYDRAGMTITTTGTGTTLSLGSALGAVAPNICSWQSFATAGAQNSDPLRILILDTGNAWEISTVAYSTTGPQLTGRTLEASSTGSLLSLSGSAQVYIMAGAGDILTAFNGRGGGAITPAAGDYDVTQIYKAKWFGGRVTLMTGNPVMTFGTFSASASWTTSSTTITMAVSNPGWVVAGMNVFDTKNNKQIGTVSSWSSTTLTLTAAAANASQGTTDTLQFQPINATKIYYTPYIHDLISIYDGTRFVTFQFTEQFVTLDTTNFLSGKLYDLFIFNNSGTPTLGYGPAWTSSSARSAAITQLQGVWVNNASITLRTNSSTTFSVSANQATYIGTAYGTANGQTGMAFIGSAAGGGGNILGLFNAQNQVHVGATNNDTTVTWSYSSTTWRKANNNANNSISYVDGLGICTVNAVYEVFNTSSTTEGNSGVALNWVSGAPAFLACADNVTGNTATAASPLGPALGFNVVNAVEQSNAATSTTWDANGFEMLCASLNM